MNTYYFRNTVPGSVLSKTTHLQHASRFHVREHFVRAARLAGAPNARARLQHISSVGACPAASASMKTPSADAVMSSRSYIRSMLERGQREVRVRHRLELRVRLRRVAVFVRRARRRHRRRQRGDAGRGSLGFQLPHRARLLLSRARATAVVARTGGGGRADRAAPSGRGRVAALGRRATAQRARATAGVRALRLMGVFPETSSPPLDAARHRAACARAEPTRERVTRATRTASIAETPNMSCPS